MSSAHPSILDQLGRGEPRMMSRAGGGCIADARIATFDDGSRVFVKTASGSPGMFFCEAEGLRALGRTGAIRVPEVLFVSADGLVLEMIEQGNQAPGFAETFGRRFARLHAHRGNACGFAQDNFIGATAQPNAPLDGDWQHAEDPHGTLWPEFFLERRLRFQVRLAAERGYPEPARLLESAELKIIELLGAAIEPPSILHGDLWSGNYLVDETGEACLIDPAVYYGHREADLAMTHLFGGFDSKFYGSYHESLPLEAGHRERLPIYQLYHLLNHSNLFGGSYYQRSITVLQSLAN